MYAVMSYERFIVLRDKQQMDRQTDAKTFNYPDRYSILHINPIQSEKKIIYRTQITCQK